jgi:lysozyme family protein
VAEGNFQSCLSIVLRLEGGLVEDSADPDAIMNLGVSLRALQHWWGCAPTAQRATPQTIRDLTPAQVAPLYRIFWSALHADYLPAGVDLAAFDCAVNYTPAVGIGMLQKVLGLPPSPESGLVGPDTINAAIDTNPNDLIDALAELRRLSDSEPSVRISAIVAEAKTMALRRAA